MEIRSMNADVVDLEKDDRGWVSFDCPNCGQHLAADASAIGIVSATAAREAAMLRMLMRAFDTDKDGVEDRITIELRRADRSVSNG